MKDRTDVVELFAVAPGEDERFRAAWAQAAPPGAALVQALRDDVRLRFASLERGAPAGGVLLIAAFDVPATEHERFLAAWDRALAVFAGRRGYLGAALHGGPVAVVHWSSPLMYARTVREEGDVIAALPFPAHAALYR